MVTSALVVTLDGDTHKQCTAMDVLAGERAEAETVTWDASDPGAYLCATHLLEGIEGPLHTALVGDLADEDERQVHPLRRHQPQRTPGRPGRATGERRHVQHEIVEDLRRRKGRHEQPHYWAAAS